MEKYFFHLIFRKYKELGYCISIFLCEKRESHTFPLHFIFKNLLDYTRCIRLFPPSVSCFSPLFSLPFRFLNNKQIRMLHTSGCCCLNSYRGYETMLFVPQYATFSESFVCSTSFGAHPMLCGNRKIKTNVNRIADLIRFFIVISLSLLGWKQPKKPGLPTRLLVS